MKGTRKMTTQTQEPEVNLVFREPARAPRNRQSVGRVVDALVNHPGEWAVALTMGSPKSAQSRASKLRKEYDGRAEFVAEGEEVLAMVPATEPPARRSRAKS